MQAYFWRLAGLPFAIALVVSIQVVGAHPASTPAHDASKASEAFGKAGDAKAVTRTIAIHSTDAMRFDPNSLAIKQGETVRLRITNDGALPHEFVLGTRAEIDEHAKAMRQMPNMTHTDPNAVRIAPGQTAELIWTFSQAGSFLYACLIPGHWEAGMQGTVTVAAPAKR